MKRASRYSSSVVSPQVAAAEEREVWLKGHMHLEMEPKAKGPFYPTNAKLHFPLNPFFRPNLPISNKTKNDIHALYTENPKEKTPEVLADLYGLSVVRVKAILRLKALERQYSKLDIPIQENLARKMDFLMGSVELTAKANRVAIERYEPLKPILSERLKPYFTMLEEDVMFTPEDAAKLLQRDPLANSKMHHRVDKDAPSLRELSTAKVVAKDPKNSSNFMFMFHVKSSHGKDCLVRERDGTLRKATKNEIIARKL